MRLCKRCARKAPRVLFHSEHFGHLLDDRCLCRLFGKDFSVSEDFWKRDYLKPEIKQALSSGNAQLYLNGVPAGRVGYLVLTEHFGNFLRAICSESRWKFRSPANLEESSMLVELQLRTIGTLFKMSDYPAPYIAGDVQMKQLAAPLDCIPF